MLSLILPLHTFNNWQNYTRVRAGCNHFLWGRMMLDVGLRFFVPSAGSGQALQPKDSERQRIYRARARRARSFCGRMPLQVTAGDFQNCVESLESGSYRFPAYAGDDKEENIDIYSICSSGCRSLRSISHRVCSARGCDMLLEVPPHHNLLPVGEKKQDS